jgi:acetoin utilization protein AcuC
VSGRSAFLFSSELGGYRLSETHPLDPIRLTLTESLIQACGLLDAPNVFRESFRGASDDEIRLVHDTEYIQRVKELGADPRFAHPYNDFGIGSGDNPAFVGMHDASALVVGASVRAAELVWSGAATHAFSPGGGLHHAMRRQASGFCVYNDASVAVAWLRAHGARVAYVDTDAHHGDGVQASFYGDPNVLTISMHESGRFLFPGTGGVEERGEGRGKGFAANVPMFPYSDHESFVECFDLVVPTLIREFRPDVIVTQNGVDAHALDPLTHLHATTPSFEYFARQAHALAHELCEGRLVALGGGGYALWTVVPRAWTAVWAAISDQPLPTDVPPEWLQRWEPHSPVDLPLAMHDSPGAFPNPHRGEIAEANLKVATTVAERGFR